MNTEKNKTRHRLFWLIKHYIAFINRDIFSIDGFEYDQKTKDVYVHYHVTGKRNSYNRKTVDEIIKSEKLINSFSRIDAAKIGQLYGRSQERKKLVMIQNQEKLSDTN